MASREITPLAELDLPRLEYLDPELRGDRFHEVMLDLAEHPDQWALLAERPELAPQAVEEALRHEPIVPFTARITVEEVERMAGELSQILGHVDKMNELDLEGVEPTSHVVELQNVLREDAPRPSLPRERALEQAPDVAEGGFRVPTPGHG